MINWVSIPWMIPALVHSGLKLRFRSLQGVLQDGQQIAVKKLSLESRQGVREFLNEVRLLLKVQHRNLVSLLGCCASSGQKMLVYPYFPNGSLDHILFSKNSSAFPSKKENSPAFCSYVLFAQNWLSSCYIAVAIFFPWYHMHIKVSS